MKVAKVRWDTGWDSFATATYIAICLPYSYFIYLFFLQKTYSFSYIRIFYLCKKESFIHLSWEQKSKYLIPEVSVHSSIETLSHFLVYNPVIRFILMIFATKPSSIKVFISIKRCKATENIDIRKLAKMSNKPPIRILKICKCVFQGL